VVCHSLLQWSTFCQSSLPWPVHLGWPYTAWLSFTELDKAVSMWSVWLIFCDCGFHSVCPLIDNDKRLMEASWWDRLIVGVWYGSNKSAQRMRVDNIKTWSHSRNKIGTTYCIPNWSTEAWPTNYLCSRNFFWAESGRISSFPDGEVVEIHS